MIKEPMAFTLVKAVCITFFQIVMATAFFYFCNAQDKRTDRSASFEEMQKATLSHDPVMRPPPVAAGISFRYAAKKAIPAVVSVRYFSASQSDFSDFFKRLFGNSRHKADLTLQDSSQYVGSASGVLITSSGYIVTNYHVIDETDSLEIVLTDQRRYKAQIIGADASTDIALLKVEETGLPFIEFGSSDSVEVGDLILTVGNPLDLPSTVTAGVLSAKTRNLKLLKDRSAIESYIQTDAIVTFGNSGGALLDFQGKLIGITAAVSTFTDDYTGYCFAIPVEIVKKVVNDLLRYGKLMRGFLGVTVSEMAEKRSQTFAGTAIRGVFIDSLLFSSTSRQAGLQTNDLITSINKRKTESIAELLGIIVRYPPGEIMHMTIVRKGQLKNYNVRLMAANELKNMAISEKELLTNLGIEIGDLDTNEKKRLKVSGVKVLRINRGEIASNTTMRPGFVIIKINNKPVHNTQELIHELIQKAGLMIAEGIYPGSEKVYYYEFRIDYSSFI